MDDKLVFSDAQAITVSAASAFTLNFGLVNPNIGEGTPLIIRFVVEEAFTTGTSIVIALQDGATSTPTNTLLETDVILTAEIAAKGAYIPEIRIPDHHAQYLRLYYTVVGTYDHGKLTAYVTLNK